MLLRRQIFFGKLLRNIFPEAIPDITILDVAEENVAQLVHDCCRGGIDLVRDEEC